jgi:hypothetical protein
LEFSDIAFLSPWNIDEGVIIHLKNGKKYYASSNLTDLDNFRKTLIDGMAAYKKMNEIK